MSHFILASETKPTCTLVIDSLYNESQVYAAGIIAKIAKEVSGADLPIIDKEPPCDGDKVLLGSPTNNPLMAEILESDAILQSSADLAFFLVSTDSGNRLILGDLGEQGFIMYCTEHNGAKCLILAGKTDQGVIYAANTIADRLFMQGDELIVDKLNTRINPILNLPAFEIRSIAGNQGGPDWLGHNVWEKEWERGGSYDYKAYIDWMVSHKVNCLNMWLFDLAFGIAYDSERFPEAVNRHHPNVKHEFMSDLIEYAHKRYIKIFFFVDFPDNWTAIVKAYPQLAGANVDVSEIPTGDKWELYQRSGEGRGLPGGGEVFRGKFSWVCASKPKTMDFWRGYWDELLNRYPDVDGIGGQFCEHPETRCNCPNCQQNFFELQWRFFDEMAKIARAKNPNIQLWAYRSWGAREIWRHRRSLPNLIWIDWGGDFRPYYFRHSVPRGDWYLYHTSGAEWAEHGTRLTCQIFSQAGLKGYEHRGVYYSARWNVYQAFAEFTWNPYLSVEDYAWLFCIKEFRREESKVAKAYSHWIKALEYANLLQYGSSQHGLIEQDNYKQRLRKELDDFTRAVAEIGEIEAPFVQKLRMAASKEANDLRRLV